MAGFGAASLPLLSCIALLAGAILLILGFATSNWANDGTYNVGLWQYGKCVHPHFKDCYHYDQPSLMRVPTWLHVVRALECCSVLFVSLPLITLPIYMYIALGMYYKCMMLTMCILSFLSSLTGFIGIGIYGYNVSDNNWDIEWGFIVVIVGCCLILIGFLVLLVALISKRPESLKEMTNFYPETIFVDPDKNQLYTVHVEDD